MNGRMMKLFYLPCILTTHLNPTWIHYHPQQRNTFPTNQHLPNLHIQLLPSLLDLNPIVQQWWSQSVGHISSPLEQNASQPQSEGHITQTTLTQPLQNRVERRLTDHVSFERCQYERWTWPTADG